MAYRGYVGEIPAGEGGANFDQNAGRVPITDLIDADGVVVQDGLLQREPGADPFGASGLKAQATLSAATQWGVAAVSLKGSGIAYVAASLMTSNADVGVGPTFKVELTVPAGGIASGSCIVVSSHLFTLRNDSTCVCTDDAGNTYTLIGPSGPTTVARVFVALNALALVSGQKITLTFDAMSMSLHHVAVGNEFTGILTSSAIDKSGVNASVGDDTLPNFLYGSFSSLPELLVMAGNAYEPSSLTVTANLGFVKCGEATNGPGASRNRGWQQYRIDTAYIDPQLFVGAPAIKATLAGGNPLYQVTLGASLRGASIALVAASTMTNVNAVPATAPYRIQLTVPAGGIASGSCISVSSCLRAGSVASTCVCTDDAGNTYTEVIGRKYQFTHTRLFIALNALALSSGQKITLTFNSVGGGYQHVAIGNEFTGITVTEAIDQTAEGAIDGGYAVFLPLGSISSVPQLILGAAGFIETPVATTVTADQGFVKCGDAKGASIGGQAVHSWQQYRIDSTSPTVIGLHDWRPTSTVQRVITATLTGNIYKEVDGDLDAVVLASGLSFTARPGKFVEGGQEAPGNSRKLFYFNGVDPVKVLSADGVTMATISKKAADWNPYWPLSGTIHRNRHAAWGNLNDPHRLYLSTSSDHEDFQTNTGADIAYTFSCYPSIGDRLYSAAKYLGLLWLFKWPRGIFWLDDSDPDQTLWSLQMQTEALGCAPTPYGALGIGNDIMILSASGHFHLLSAVQGGVIRDSNLSMAMRHAKWLRDHLNLSKLSQVISIWYPHKKWAVWGLPSTGSSVNDLVVLFDFSEVNEPGELPRLFFSHRDNVDALALRLEADQIQRPMLGEGGILWLLDRETRSKSGAGYTSRYQTARTDFSHIEPRLAAREKIFEHLEIVKTPTTGTLTVKVVIDGVVTKTLSFDLSRRRQRERIGGSGFELSLIGENEDPNINFLIERHLVFFDEGEEGRI